MSNIPVFLLQIPHKIIKYDRIIKEVEFVSSINLKNESCAEQQVDAIVNAANRNLLAGGGICGVIFEKAGYIELNEACSKYKVPLQDGDAVITPAFNMKNSKYIIHAVGPNFEESPNSFDKLFNAYYNSLKVLKDNKLHSISFPLISSGIFGGNLENPPAISTQQCLNAYKKFIIENKEYNIEVVLCAYSIKEMNEAEKVFNMYINKRGEFER